MFGAIHDDLTCNEDDDTTVCETEVMAATATHRGGPPMQRNDSEDNGENPLQFGFENIVFEIDNRCDDQKSSKEPIKYCSLAKFVEGNDIARKSFKVRGAIIYFYVFLADKLIHIYYFVQRPSGSSRQTLLAPTTESRSLTRSDSKHISFDESCKKEDRDEVSGKCARFSHSNQSAFRRSYFY